MNSNKILAILGLLLLLRLAIGSVSASDMDSEIVGDSADIDLISEEAIIDETDKSNIAEEENTEMTIADAVEDDLSDSDSIDSIQGTEKDSVGVKNDLGANNLASTIKFKESSYSTYFDNNGNILSGKLKSGDILDFSGKFTDKMFIINIPLIVTSTDRTAQLTNCGFKFINGSSGSSISNLKMDNTIANRPLIAASDVNDMEIYNNNLFATGRSSHPMSFSRVNRLHIYKNTLQSSGYVQGWGQPSAMVLNNAGSCNITQNTVITNDSNGIYFSGYGANTGMGAGEDAASYSNYIVNNTVYSIRPLPSSFVYAIQVMSSYNYIINNTVYNAYRGISTTGSNNQIIGNTISRIHGAYYSQTTEEQGGEAAIISGSNSIVKENIISDCLFNQDIKGTAINVNGNSIVTDNIIKNCTGNGLVLKGGNVTFTNNKLNVSGYGVFAEGNMADVDMEMNVIDSSNQHAIHLARTSRYDYPHDFIIQNNTLYSTADEAIYMDDVCTNILRSNNIIIGESGSPIVDNDTTHIINEKNFYNYFSLTGSFNNRVKENDTVIFVGDFSSKGKLNINKNVIIQGVNAIFEDTTFLISEVDDLIFENINITNPNKKLSDRMWGIQISGSNNVTVRNCSISIYDPNSAFAIYVLDSNACKILNNSLEAVGDYFTAALFSFNSTNLLVDGNTLNTIGTGETYLCNNQSCLNILVKGVTICPDGTVICPDGAGSNWVLDGVIPGTHMISGLFRAYGALFVHSSNNNFTNNVVNVGSALSPFYKLNESCNTIAGVFIHYGGFNNTISNNNITLNSNDPIIYAIGIVGASSNSTAVGSKNNSFISNRVSVKSLYHGVGIYLGYKAINSTFANNNFIINAINAYEIVNRTLVENDENVLEGNTFEIITPHYTALTVSSVSYKWNNGNKYVSITLKDLNGTLIPNQQITFTLDGKNYTGTTNAKGVATVKVTLNKVGAFDIVAYFDGSENFIPSTNKGKITLTKDSTSLAAAGKTYAVTASAKTIAVTLKDGSGKAIANRKITATVNGKTFSATTNAKGVATIKLTLTAVKTYKVALKFAGDSYYTGSTKSIKVKVTKTKTKLTVPKKTYKKSKKVKKLTATLKDNAGKKIKGKKLTFIVNKKKYTAKTNKKGVATVKVKLSKKKTFKFTVKFAGDKTYVAVKKTGKLVIK